MTDSPAPPMVRSLVDELLAALRTIEPPIAVNYVDGSDHEDGDRPSVALDGWWYRDDLEHALAALAGPGNSGYQGGGLVS